VGKPRELAIDVTQVFSQLVAKATPGCVGESKLVGKKTLDVFHNSVTAVVSNLSM